jgi:hypothetical protein
MPEKNIVTDIISKNYQPMRNWSLRNRAGGSHSILMKNVRQILNLISGGNLILMLKNVLTEEEKQLLLGKHIRAIRNYSKIFNQTSQKQRHKYLQPIRESGLSYKKSRKLGFQATTHMWKNCLNEAERKKGGRDPVNDEIVKEIESHLESLSSIAANRFLKKLNTNAFYCQVSLVEAYDQFHLKNDLSFSTFYTHVPTKFKKPHRFSDLCDYCEYNRELKNDIVRVANVLNYQNLTDLEPVDLEEFKEYLITIDTYDVNIEETISKIHKSQAIDYHKMVAKRQRDACNKMRNDAKYIAENLIIEIDFKQKVILSKSPKERSTDYYQQQQSYLGFGVYVIDERGDITCINMDVVLNNTSQDCVAVISAFRHIREQDIFKKYDKKNYTVWTDCGTHFRYF